MHIIAIIVLLIARNFHALHSNTACIEILNQLLKRVRVQHKTKKVYSDSIKSNKTEYTRQEASMLAAIKMTCIIIYTILQSVQLVQAFMLAT